MTFDLMRDSMKASLLFLLLGFSAFLCSVEFVSSDSVAFVIPFVEAPGVTNTTVTGCFQSSLKYEAFDSVADVAEYSMGVGAANAVFKNLAVAAADYSGCAGSTGKCATVWTFVWKSHFSSLSIPSEINTFGVYFSPSDRRMSIKFKDANNNQIFHFDEEKFLMLVNDNYKGKPNDNGVKTHVLFYYAYVNFIVKGVAKIEFNVGRYSLWDEYKMDNLFLGICPSSRVDPYGAVVAAEERLDTVTSKFDANCREVANLASSDVTFSSGLTATFTNLQLENSNSDADAAETGNYAVVTCDNPTTVAFSSPIDYFGFNVSPANEKMLFEFRGENDVPLYSMRYNAFVSALTEELNYTTEEDKKNAFINFNIQRIKSVKFSLECEAEAAEFSLGLDNFTINKCSAGNEMM